MARSKKKGEAGRGKADLRKAMCELMERHPGRSYNYKQMSKSLNVHRMDTKRLVFELLKELADAGELTEVSTGRFKCKKNRVLHHRSRGIDGKRFGLYYLGRK